MNRIEKSFADARAEDRGHLIVYITAGHPCLKGTEMLVPALAEAGVDMIELGIPFSDPLADGPIIQSAGQQALARGCTVAGVMESVTRIREQTDIPIAFMTCWNPILQNDPATFAKTAKAAGVDGMLVTDLPPEEAGDWLSIVDANDMQSIFLVAPASTPERIEKAAELSTGFVYCVARAGVTGVRDEVSPELKGLVSRIREKTDKPISVGFGVSKADHVREVCKLADGAIVGSAMVKLIDDGDSPESIVEQAAAFAADLATGKER